MRATWTLLIVPEMKKNVSAADKCAASETKRRETAEAADIGGIGGGGYGKKRFPGFNRKDEKMDPVGKEDDDIDNDGDVDSSDKYLKKRRKAIGKAMKKESLDSIRDLIQKELKNL